MRARRSTWLIAVAGCVAVGLAGLVGQRVLAPAEVSYPAADPVPAAESLPAGVTGRVPTAPLIVDGRVRVFAADRAVKADGPPRAPKIGTPSWSFRRWPERLVGVVAARSTVVTRWSDGRLVALRADTGEVAWRYAGPEPAPAANPTGAALTRVGTVWTPPGLHTTAGTSVLVTDGRDGHVLDVVTGALRRRIALPPGCGPDGFTTTAGRYVCTANGSSVDLGTQDSSPPGPSTPDAGSPDSGPPATVVGPVTPLGCGTADSECAALRDAAGQGLLLTRPVARAVPALRAAGSTVVAGTVVSAPGPVLVATAALTGAELWRWTAPAGDSAQVIGGAAGVVHLLTGQRELVTVDARTGAERSRFVLRYPSEKRVDWAVGAVHVAGPWIAVERLATGGAPGPGSPEHYWAELTVLLAVT